jgi:ParB family chromosome partitioning protein
MLDITHIELNKIKPNTYNPNVVPEDMMAKLRAEIGHKGLCEPILVRSRDDGYEIIDGEHRWQICRDLGWEKIPCIVKDYDDAEAKIKTLQLNYLRGSVVPIRLAHLIHDLNKESNLEDLEKRLPYEKPELMDCLELLKLPDDFGKSLEYQAMEEAKEMPEVMTFVVPRLKVECIEKALEKASQWLPEGTKNRKALALVEICFEFLEAQQVKEELENEKDADINEEFRS